ncbi:MAG: hypothetical protein F2813_07975 [Actinobacteria bacterium]|uniref:Unannotated protein n=1 Tax=freshwater metagenome TaxID=449393 RepID=A0A6J5ZZW2_9ZZZZ|nr:hypothetical protein [Actinomycetota bacterium]
MISDEPTTEPQAEGAEEAATAAPEPAAVPAEPVAEQEVEQTAVEETAAEVSQEAASATPEPDTTEKAEEPKAEKPKAEKPKGKPKGKKPRGKRPPQLPKTRGQLPIDELRAASKATIDLFGAQQAIRASFAVLATKERQDISALIAADDDHRTRARNVANGSLGAGRIDKAMAATIVAMAPAEDLWIVTLDKEQASQRLGRVRAAKQRDRERDEKKKERKNSSERVSRDQLKAAQDGRVGATIRFVTDEDRRERRSKDDARKAAKKSGSVLDKLGY